MVNLSVCLPHVLLMQKLHVIILFTTLITAACTPRTEAQAVKPDYDTETDCLNGTMIVSLDGKYGLADTSGKEILPTAYDDVYYISDEVAVAFTGQDVGFFDRNGRRLGETVVVDEADVDGLLAAYSEIEKACREQWDGILASYEDLRRYCVSDSASASTATLMAEDIKTALQKVSGPMEKDQKVRFENELSAYRR